MNIGIDIRLLESHHRYRGIGVYLESLLGALARIDSRNCYFLFTASGSAINFKFPPSFSYKLISVGPLPANLLQRLKAVYRPLSWDSRTYELDVLLQPDIANGLPRGHAKSISILYDLIPIIYRDKYYPKRRLGKSWLVQRFLLMAYRRQLKNYKKLDRLIAISRSSKNDLVKFDPAIDPRKISVIPLGINGGGKISRRPAFASKLRPNFFLYVGSCDYRKNVIDVVRAFQLYRSNGNSGSLVLVGRDFQDAMPNDLRRAINSSPYRRDIVLPGFAQPDELNWLYSQASAFLFASLYEGFGLPPLETMSHSCPVISYCNSSLTESLGKAVLWASDAADMAASMIKLQEEPKFREALVNKGLKQASHFTWESTAAQTLKLIESLK